MTCFRLPAEEAGSRTVEAVPLLRVPRPCGGVAVTTGRVRARIARGCAVWSRFWFEPQETSTLAVVRVFFGLVVLAWSLSLLPDLGCLALITFFSSRGLLPKQPAFDSAGLWGPLGFSRSFAVVVVVYVAVVIAAICLILGFASRLACAIIWIGVLAFTRRNPYVFNAGDAYLRVVAFYLMLTPAGASLSLRCGLGTATVLGVSTPLAVGLATSSGAGFDRVPDRVPGQAPVGTLVE